MEFDTIAAQTENPLGGLVTAFAPQGVDGVEEWLLMQLAQRMHRPGLTEWVEFAVDAKDEGRDVTASDFPAYVPDDDTVFEVVFARGTLDIAAGRPDYERSVMPGDTWERTLRFDEFADLDLVRAIRDTVNESVRRPDRKGES